MRTAAVGMLVAGALLAVHGPRPAHAQSPGGREAGALAGEILSPSGEPLSGASVANFSSGDEARTGSRGRFRFAPARRGFHVLLVAHPRYGADTVRAPVTNGKTSFLELRFRERGSLEKEIGLADGAPGEGSLPAADTVSGTARILGRLVDREGDRPVEAANLSLEGSSLRATTDEDGRFSLDSLPAGTHRLHVEHVGYGARELVVEVPAGRTARVEIGLTPDAVPMPPIEVETELRSEGLDEAGFYRRRDRGRKIGTGSFLVANEIVGHGGDLAQVLATMIPKLRNAGRIRVDGTFVSGLVYFPRYDEELLGACLPAIFLDDHKIVGSGSPEKATRALGPNGVASLAAPSQVTGIEVYDSPASTLGRYQGSDSRCGVIAIWTHAG